MGRQVNFYMNADDQSKMNDIILAEVPYAAILKDETDKQELEFLDTTEYNTRNGKNPRIYIARKQDIQSVIIDPPFKIKIPPYNVRNIINQDISPVVEYWRCVSRIDKINLPVIQSGRIYYHAKYCINNHSEWVQKDPEFIKFAQKLFNLFKKNLTYIKERGYYYGEGALLDEKNGWKLTM